MHDFSGVKIILQQGDKMIVILRDNIPNLPYAGLWDLPGGGREPRESPMDCILREVREELNFDLHHHAIIWQKRYPALPHDHFPSYFMAALIHDGDLEQIRFGNEGQGWELMSFDEYLARDDVVEPFKPRIRDYLSGIS